MARSNGSPSKRDRKGGGRFRQDGDGAQQAGSVLGRAFPHSQEAEEGLLACCLLDPEVLNTCLEARLEPASFFHPSHQLVFEAASEVWQKHSAIDEILLAEELKSREVLEEIGGLPFLNQLTDRVETTAHSNHFLAIVREKHMLRRLIRMSASTIERCYNLQDGLDQFLEEVEREVFSLSEDRVSETAQPIKESVKEAYNLIEKLLKRAGELSGVPSGFVDLDKMTYGFKGSEMIVLAARPSMGKTSLALNIAESAVLPKPEREATPTLVFSLEMSSEQLAMRLLCGRARVSMIRLRDGISSSEERQRLLQTADEVSKAPLWIDDSGNLNILEMRAKCRRLKSRHDIGLIVVDYLQLLSGTDSSVAREQQISEISRGIKGMAKELNVPVIVLSQLNRDSEKERRQPRLSDLRESGSIEQDADVVLMLARPKDATDDFSVATDRADLIIAKQRNGPVGTVPLTFIQEITRFENYTGHAAEPS